MTRAAEAALIDHDFVTALDVLQGVGWLAPSHVDLWRQGRSPCLESEIQANLDKVSEAMRLVRQWAERKGLRPSETTYLSRTRGRGPLQFSVERRPPD